MPMGMNVVAAVRCGEEKHHIGVGFIVVCFSERALRRPRTIEQAITGLMLFCDKYEVATRIVMVIHYQRLNINEELTNR